MAQYIIPRVKNTANSGVYNAHCSNGGSCNTDSGGGCLYSTTVGGHTVTVTHKGYVTRSQYVYISTDEWKYVYFDNAHGNALRASIEGTVYDEDNDPIPNIIVWVSGTLLNTDKWGCVTNSNGQYSLPVFTAGYFIVYCGKNNYDIMSGVNYYQASTIPTSTTIINFSGDTTPRRSSTGGNHIGVYNRSFVIKDDLDMGYYYPTDIPSYSEVYAKVRKWNGSTLKCYDYMVTDYYVRDGSGGNQYE